jgi:hypothetical protein
MCYPLESVEKSKQAILNNFMKVIPGRLSSVLTATPTKV